MLGGPGKRKDTVINLECHVYPWLRCPRVQLMEKSDSALIRGIRLLTGWRSGWTCPLGYLVRSRESMLRLADWGQPPREAGLSD